MGTKEDHDLLIRIDERLADIQRDYATRADITAAIQQHKLDDHNGKGHSYPPKAVSKATKERIVYITSIVVATALAVAQALT